ncbi:MAG: hypothetical protein PHC38_06430 [Weeksellaceae bacterium]|nr:hypothetical protein [Weeksellaceae bacterium]
MKTQIIKLTLILSLLFALTNCKKISEKVSTTVFEKAYESSTGQKIDAIEIGNMEKNKVTIDLKFGSPELDGRLNGDEIIGMVTAMEDAISVSVSVDGGEVGMLMSFNGDELKNKKPIKGSPEGDINFSAAILFMGRDVEGMESWSSDDAVGELLTLNDKKAVLKAKGTFTKIGGEEKVPFDGTITIDYPVFQAIGGKKSDFEY